MNHTRPSSAAFVFERHRRDASSRKRTHVILLAVALFALLLGPDAAVASHVPSLLLHPEAATGWTNPSGALSQPDADYARTSADGASLAITGYADPTASGTITTVNLKIDQLQGSHSDDRYLFSANAAGCGQVNLDAPNPEATIGRQTLTTRVDCANGWTWDRLDTIAAAIQSDAQGGVGGIFDVDGEWRVYYAWLEVAYVNQAPTASAGPDRTVVEGAVVVLDGSGSVEPDGEAVSFTWTQVAGPVIALGGPSTSSPTFTAPVLPTNVPVVATFRVTVADASQHSAADDIVVTISNLNQAPVANAGPNQVVATRASVNLVGTASSDPDSDALSYQWTQVEGPLVSLANPQSANSAFTAPAQTAQLAFSLVVTDALGAASTASRVTVQVEAPAPTSTPPATSAAPPQAAPPISTSPSSSSPPSASPPSSLAPPLAPEPSSPTPLPWPGAAHMDNATQACRASLPPGPLPENASAWRVSFPPGCFLQTVLVHMGDGSMVALNLSSVPLTHLPDTVGPPPAGVLTSVIFHLDLASSNATVQPGNATLRFDVPRTWLTDRCPPETCEVRLFHHHNESWDALPTRRVAENETSATYESETGSFSLFVAGGIPKAFTVVREPDAPFAWHWLVLVVGLAAAGATGLALQRRQRTPSGQGLPAGASPDRAETTATGAPPIAHVDAKVSRLLREMRANEDLLQFVNNAAHDLSNPLTPITLQLSMLQAAADATSDERQRKSLAVVRRNVEQLTMLVQDLKDAAKLQAGKLRIDAQPADLSLIATEVGESYEEQAQQGDLVLEVRATEPLPVLADSGRIVQVLSNFLNNALKFTPKGGKVSLETAREGENALVLVRDTGLGLSPEDQARLFKPFSQAHGPEQKKKGTGLGLFISRGIIEAHQGRIGCESPGPGQGSTFWVSVPIRATDASTSVEGKDASRAAGATTPRAPKPDSE